MVKKMTYKENFHILDLGFTKCYLFECFDGYLLIDTSYNGKYSKFLKEMEKKNINLSQIKYIFITHHHADHAGFAARLVEETGAKLIIHQNSLDPLKKGKNEDVLKPVNARIRIIFPFLRIHLKITKFPPVLPKNEDIILKCDDDQLLRGIGIKGKILCTPGHSKDSISVIMDNGNAFVGDLAMNNSKSTSYKPALVESIDTVFEEWDKLIKNGAKTIYPAHGDSFAADELIIPGNK